MTSEMAAGLSVKHAFVPCIVESALLEWVSMELSEALLDTQLAFDSVAKEYDGVLGNNALVQRIRTRTVEAVRQNLLPGSRLLDLGCGTGLDVEFLARNGYRITAIDWSAEMIQRTHERIAKAKLHDRALVKHLGFHQLDELPAQDFDGAY